MNDETKRGVDAILRLRDCDLAPGITRAAFVAGLLRESDQGLADDYFHRGLDPYRGTPVGLSHPQMGRDSDK